MILQEFIEWCHEGPRAAVVREVQVAEGEVKGFENFQITNTAGDNPYGPNGER